MDVERRDDLDEPDEPAEQGDEQADEQDEQDEEIGPENSTMRELVEYMARGLVEQPDQVSVTTVEGKASVIFELRVAPEDMGKIIGKDGRVAKAMRTLLKVAAAKERKRAILEIV
jgi:predicted RNA-binding protein YlqC (UPF0109 family)